MCLLFFSYRTTPGYDLVVAANRDEFLSRPTAPLRFIDEQNSILAGLDLQGGGTWLGLTTELKFGAITNYREPLSVKTDAPSRGEILINYFEGNMGARQYIHSLAEGADRYNGFNLILGDSRELYYYSNKFSGPQLLSPGFYGLSNHLLDSPWPKVTRGKNLLRSSMVESDTINSQRIFSLLEDKHQPPDEQLPETGVGREWERLLGTIFIDGHNYGTRSSALITVTDNGFVEFIEKSFVRAEATVNTICPECKRYTLQC